jgi:predicted phage terminase large subunit-like protein
MQDCEFESNFGGDRVGEEIDKRVLNKGWICNITAKATETNKEARIFQCSNWVLQHVVFKDSSLYAPKDQYGVMMAQLLSYSVSRKNPHDDVPDVFSNFALRIRGKNRIKKTIIRRSPI